MEPAADLRGSEGDADPMLVALGPAAPPLSASDTEIDDAVAEARLLPLVMAVVHMTGSLNILDAVGETSPPTFSTDSSGGISGARGEALRAMAADAIKGWRDAGCPAPVEPDEDGYRRMFAVLAGRPLATEYEPLLKEELGFGGDARALQWEHPVTDADKARLPVAIIGAGLSGIVMGHRLKQAGIPFTIIEKNEGPGGTWFENRYPGARVDVPSHCYSFSFVRDARWPELFSPWPVLRRYFAETTDRLGLTQHIRYGVEVVRAVYDEKTARWNVTLRSNKGEEQLNVAAVVSAVGQLNRPLIPQVEGAARFKGVCTHTSRWPDDLTIAGKKVIVIGTAATALQLIPELARDAGELTVFQRSPPWVAIQPEYRATITPGEQWAIDHLPGYARWYRLVLYNWAMDGTPQHMQIDPDWSGHPHSVSAANEASRIRLTEGMTAVIGNDPVLIDKLIPKYPPYVKRPGIGDGGFYRAFARPNVHLCTDGIAHFDESGIVDGKGFHHEADIVVYATGFRALEYLSPMEIVGRDGERIDAYWGDEPRAYLGITIPNFPNLFLMYGPGTNLGFNGNLFFNGECQARFIANTLKWMVEDGLKAVEVKPEVYADWARRMDEALAGFTWTHEGTGNWYRNKAGKVLANSPWSMLNYWAWTREPNRDEFVITKA